MHVCGSRERVFDEASQCGRWGDWREEGQVRALWGKEEKMERIAFREPGENS